MNEKEITNRYKTAGTAGTSTLDSNSEQRLTCFKDILDLVLHMSDEEWKAVSRDMAKEVTKIEFAAASTRIVTIVSSAVVRRLLTTFRESFGTEAIIEANDKLKNMGKSDVADLRIPMEASDVICHLAQRTVTEVKDAMLEAIRRTASGANCTMWASALREDTSSQLEDLSITCTDRICDKILAMYNSEELDRPEGEKISLKSHHKVHEQINSSEEVVSISRSSSWCTISTASDFSMTTPPQAERPFSDKFISKASQVINEVLLKTEQKITASVLPHTSVSVCSGTEMNFLMETANSTAMEILQNLFVLLVQSLREHLPGVSCSKADQPAGQEQEFLFDAPKTHMDKQVASEETSAELFHDEAPQVASDLLMKRLSSDISVSLHSIEDSPSGPVLLSPSSVVLDQTVSKILNQVISEVAQELDVTNMENGSEAGLDEAQGSDAVERSDVSSNLSEVEDKKSVYEVIDMEKKPQAPIQKVSLHLYTVVREHLKGFFSFFSKSAADTRNTDTSAPSDVVEEKVSPDISGDDSVQELVKHFKKKKKQRIRAPLPLWNDLTTQPAENHQSSSHTESNSSPDAEQDP